MQIPPSWCLHDAPLYGCMIEPLQVQYLTLMTLFTGKLVHLMLLTVVFSSINPVSHLNRNHPLRFVTLTCTLTNSNDPAAKSRNLLAIDHRLFFPFFLQRPPGPLTQPPPHPNPTQHTEREAGRSNSKMRGPALLSALHQETECEGAARHHTEAPLKIHVYHSSSFIDGLSSLYVY